MMQSSLANIGMWVLFLLQVKKKSIFYNNFSNLYRNITIKLVIHGIIEDGRLYTITN
jgi:hypothetical protein